MWRFQSDVPRSILLHVAVSNECFWSKLSSYTRVHPSDTVPRVTLHEHTVAASMAAAMMSLVLLFMLGVVYFFVD